MNDIIIRQSKLFKQTNASAAVEFALVAPLFILTLFCIIVYVSIYVTLNGIQQLAAEAARASVAGLNDSERNTLAQAYIVSNTSAYPFLDPQKLSVVSGTTGASAPTYQVTVSYDMTGSFFYSFTSLLPLPSPLVKRTAAIQRGGY